MSHVCLLCCSCDADGKKRNAKTRESRPGTVRGKGELQCLPAPVNARAPQNGFANHARKAGEETAANAAALV